MNTDSLIEVLSILGLYPAHTFSFYFPIAVVVLWILFLPFAFLKRISIFYNSSLRAVFVEELVFRGILYGAILYVWHSQVLALLGSSLIFGLAHMRNLWWAGWRRSWHTSVYAGFQAGPLFALVRLLSGDIYLGILVHFLHNLFIMFPLPGYKHRVATTPTNAELKEKHVARR